MRVLAASVLVFEGLVVFFATLVAKDLSGIERGGVWVVGGSLALVCLLLAGLLRWRWAYVAGSVLQVGVIAAGVVVPVMFFLGAVFAGLWVAAIVLGRRVERFQAAHAEEPPAGR